MEEEVKPNIEYFYGLDYENKTCLDCRGAFPRWISVNNAIIICNNCAERHSKLGFNISYIREMTAEWDPYLISFIQRGGNGRFIRFCSDFKLKELSIEEKYTTKASEYYRKLILSEVTADMPPDEILMDTGLEKCSNTIYFPEFDDYQFFKGEKVENSKGSIIDSLSQSFKTVGQFIGDNDLKGEIADGGSKAFTVIKDVSGAVYDFSKPVVSYLASKTVQGAGFLLNQLSNGVSEYQNMQYQKNSLAKAKEEAIKERFNTKQDPNANCTIDDDTSCFYPNQQQFYFCNNKQTLNNGNEQMNNGENDQELTTRSSIPQPQLIENEQSVLIHSKKRIKELQNKHQTSPNRSSQYDVIAKGDKANNKPQVKHIENKDVDNKGLNHIHINH